MRQRQKDSDRKGSHLLLKTMKTKKKRNKLFLIVASVFAIVFIFSAIMFTREMRQTKQEAQTFAELAALRAPQPDPTVRKTATPTATVSPEPTPISIVIGTNEDTEPEPAPKTPPAKPTEEPATPEPTEAPTEGPTEPTPLQQYLPLYELNHDFFGWITIPDTNIDYPVMYNAKQPLQYLGHDFYGKFSYAGVPFLDSDCDPNGNFYMVYGHRMNDGTMFGQLLKYADPEFLAENPYVYILSDSGIYRYEIFAAYPHSSEHLLLNHDFSNEEEFAAYFAELSNTIDSNYRPELFPEVGDRVITLSTCYKSNRMQRYLVQGVLTMEYAIVNDDQKE